MDSGPIIANHQVDICCCVSSRPLAESWPRDFDLLKGFHGRSSLGGFYTVSTTPVGILSEIVGLARV